MSKIFTAKRLITLGIAIYFLYCIKNMFFFLGYELSPDAASSFLFGVVCMSLVFISIKGLGFLIDEAAKWIAERKKKNQYYLQNKID